MESQSARLEREAEETLWQLSETLGELRGRMTPGRVVDQVLDYTRGSPAAEFTDRARDAAGGLADKARSASTGVVTTFERAKRSITGKSTDPAMPVDMDRPAGSAAYHEDAYVDERR